MPMHPSPIAETWRSRSARCIIVSPPFVGAPCTRCMPGNTGRLSRSELDVGLGIATRAIVPMDAVQDGHLIGVELEAEDVEVLSQPRRIRGLGDGDGTNLVVPPEAHLRRGAAALRGGCGYIRSVEHRGVGAERAVRLGHDAVLVVPCAELRLAELRVELDLVHGGPDTCALDDLVDHGGGEVRDPN